MNSELDKIKSTITISLGTKNRLRKLKGNQSYEEFINYLIRVRNQITHKSDNVIEVQKFQRKKGIYSNKQFKILFSYNKHYPSNNYVFDISIDKVRKEGKIVSFDNYLNQLSKETGRSPREIEYLTYFELLQIAIRNEIEPLFNHKGRVEDHFSWEKEFKILNLPNKSFEMDIMDKLNDFIYEQGVL